MLQDSTRRGLVAYLAIAQRLIELGFEVLEPYGNHLRYDLAYYIPASSNGKAQLVRVQCKSARLSKDKTCLLFNAFNLGGKNKRQKLGYQGYAEYFGIYSPDTRKVYLIRVNECHVGEMNLRMVLTGKQGKNQYSAGVRWAKDYEI